MTMTAALLVCVVGGVLAIIPNRAQQLGVWAFGVGLWWVLSAVAGHVVHW
jgi:hypothetical protein